MYPQELVQPMKDEVLQKGFEELTSAEAVDQALSQDGTALVLINSVCGCSAGTARPGVLMAVETANQKPNQTLTAFAGFDKEAVDQVRTYLKPYPPSSPSIALFKDGKLVHFIERHMIEGRSADMIAANLKDAFDNYC